MQIQIDPNIPSNLPDEELRDFQSFIQTALDGLTEEAGGEVMALGTGMFTGLALIVIVIAGAKIAFSGNIQPWEVVRLVIGIWIPWVMMQFYTTTIPGMSQTFPGMIAEGGNFLHRMLLGNIISSMQTELGDMVRAIAANMQTQSDQGNVIGIMTGGIHVFITAVAGSIIMALLVLMLIVLFAVTYAQVIWAQIALAILIILGPIFIPFLVFEPLSFLFWGWFKGMLTYSLYAVIAGACVAGVQRRGDCVYHDAGRREPGHPIYDASGPMDAGRHSAFHCRDSLIAQMRGAGFDARHRRRSGEGAGSWDWRQRQGWQRPAVGRQRPRQQHQEGSSEPR